MVLIELIMICGLVLHIRTHRHGYYKFMAASVSQSCTTTTFRIACMVELISAGERLRMCKPTRRIVWHTTGNLYEYTLESQIAAPKEVLLPIEFELI